MGRQTIYLGRGGGLVPDAAVRGDVLYTSGIAGVDAAGNLPETNEAQAANAHERLSQLLKLGGFKPEEVGHRSARAVVDAAKFDWRDVGHVHVGYDDHARKTLVDKVWAEVFPEPGERPARHCIQESELPAGTSIGIALRAAR